ncbi:MAG TPA: zinc dependent phospholipase C family protein [Chitinophagaceae bacterium]|nr:zinc dependent phospholipase C family protein [Chitinophagaceae bacterium]
MKKHIAVVSLTVLLPFCMLLISWGTWGHQHINHAAVFALPDSMRSFFYNHIDFITEESVIPDVRKYTLNDKAEFARHYIDLESFQTSPADSVPRGVKEAYSKYDSKFLDKNGLLPWYMIEVVQKLTRAFQDKKKAEILFLAADLGHYVGDAAQPLHTSLNHDGQLTDQKGIHAFFESQLLEQFGSSYNFYTGNAVYIPDVQKEVWKLINDSHRLADTLLLAEKQLSRSFDTGNVYMKSPAGVIVKNKYNQPVHSYAYASAYHNALNGMVQRQIRVAIAATANLWYTAWVNAGRPDLTLLDEPSLTNRNRKHYKKDYKEWTKGRLFGFKIDKEF